MGQTDLPYRLNEIDVALEKKHAYAILLSSPINNFLGTALITHAQNDTTAGPATSASQWVPYVHLMFDGKGS